jgi:uncharacterized protein (DUF608 family)
MFKKNMFIVVLLVVMGQKSFSQEILNDPRLFDQGESVVYRGDYLEAISLPLGGVGSGNIQVNGKAERHIWQIFNNFSLATIPNSFFGLRVKAAGETEKIRALQISSVEPFKGMDSLTFKGEYPFGWYDFIDSELPVSVEMEVFSPFIPLQPKESAIPTAIFSFTATNTSDTEVEVSIFGTQKNAVGYTGNPIYGEIGGAPSGGDEINYFDGDNYGGWTATGNAFGSKPSGGTGSGQQTVSGFLGSGLVNTFDPYGDGATGTLRSPAFTITKNYIYFLIGGGSQTSTTGIKIIVDNVTVKTATGNNSETLVWKNWDVSQYIGKQAVIEIYDTSTGGWGHILVDQIKASDEYNIPTEGDELNYFENNSYGNWIPTGEAFGTTPSNGTGVGQQTVTGFTGSGLVNTFDPKGDGAIGKLVSPEFTINKNNIYFLIGGGKAIYTIGIRLLIDGEAVKSSTGNNKESLEWKKWDVAKYMGKTAIIEIYDDETGGWGHILVDNIILSNQSIAPNELENVGNNVNRIYSNTDFSILHMTTTKDIDNPGYGDMSLLLKGDSITGTASFSNLNDLYNDLLNDGTISGISSTDTSGIGSTYNGALNSKFILQPGESKKVTFILTWYFPNVTHGSEMASWKFQGNMYANWWTNSLDVVNYMASNYFDLYSKTKQYHDSFYESNLPHYFLDRVSSQAAVLQSKTVFWAKDGYFGGWEGTYSEYGLGHGICNHVWQYAQSHARLFPSLAKKMREQSYTYQKDDGALPHRQKLDFPAFDGQCGEIIATYREHLLNKDNTWLESNWPKIKKAMDFVIDKWDSDKDGVAHGGAWNTLDAETAGNNSWLGTLYLTALESSEKMAEIAGDATSANQYKSIKESGANLQNSQLWNEEYYIQIPEATAYDDYNTGCHIDQLLGEWWAYQVGLKNHYPDARVKTALSFLFKYNFKENFIGFDQHPRKFVDDNDAGVLMTTWPKGGRPTPEYTQMYADEVWSGQEYSLASAMISNGLLKEGFGVVLAVSDRYNGKLRTGLSPYETWGYSGNPFCDEEWGKFYARPMSVWSLLIAAQGFVYDGPLNLIGFKPKWQPDNHKSFFISATAWGLYSQQKNGDKVTCNIRVDYGTLTVDKLIFEIDKSVDTSRITLNASFPVKSFNIENGEVSIELESTQTITEGGSIQIELGNVVISNNELEIGENSVTVYPNPFSNDVCIELSMTENDKISVEIYKNSGKKIATLANSETMTQGKHRIIWNGKDNSGRVISTGMYLCKVTSKSESQSFKIIKVN